MDSKDSQESNLEVTETNPELRKSQETSLENEIYIDEKLEGHDSPVQQILELPVRYAGFWMRFWAFLLDLIVVGSIERILVNPLFRMLDISLVEANMFAPISVASAAVFYVYFVLMTKFFNQTLGKMVFGIKVVDLHKQQLTWGTVLFREWIGRFISATIVIGYIIVAFLPKKQGLHDLFTDTTVVHTE